MECLRLGTSRINTRVELPKYISSGRTRLIVKRALIIDISGRQDGSYLAELLLYRQRLRGSRHHSERFHERRAPVRNRRLGKNAARDARKRFDLHAYVDQHLKWYEQLLQDSTPSIRVANFGRRA